MIKQGVAREIKVVSGVCDSLPLLWTIKVYFFQKLFNLREKIVANSLTREKKYSITALTLSKPSRFPPPTASQPT